MLYLILAIVTSAMVSVFMRLSGEKVKNNIAMLAVSYITSTLISALYMSPGSFELATPGLGKAIAMSVVNGILYVSGLVLMQRNIPKYGVVLTSTYMRLGLIVCMALSVVLFREIPTLAQSAGFCLAVGAIILNGDSGRQRGGSRFRPGLVLIMLSSGVIDTWIKVFGALGDKALSDQFLMGTFISAALLCLGAMLYKKQRIGAWELVFGAAVAVPNYYNSRFLLRALQSLPGIVVYPSFNVATLLLIMLLGICLFKERLSRRQYFAIAVILLALALLNM